MEAKNKHNGYRHCFPSGAQQIMQDENRCTLSLRNTAQNPNSQSARLFRQGTNREFSLCRLFFKAIYTKWLQLLGAATCHFGKLYAWNPCSDMRKEYLAERDESKNIQGQEYTFMSAFFFHARKRMWFNMWNVCTQPIMSWHQSPFIVKQCLHVSFSKCMRCFSGFRASNNLHWPRQHMPYYKRSFYLFLCLFLSLWGCGHLFLATGYLF